MPKGQAAVNWTHELDAKLLITIIAVQNIQIDYNLVAKAFGPGIPGSCIQTRMRALRKKAKELGVENPSSPAGGSNGKTENYIKPDPATPTSTPSFSFSSAKRSRGAEGASSSTPTKKVKKEKGIVKLEYLGAERDEDDETGVIAPTPPSSEDGNHQPSPPLQNYGGQPRSRISPRNLAKKNYREIVNPFARLNGEHGENLFGDEKSVSEDSVGGSDGEFGVIGGGFGRGVGLIKTEPIY